METQVVRPLDFRKMFDEATKLEQERTSNRAKAFERKRKAILTKIQMLEKKSVTIVEEFLSTVEDGSFDEISKLYLSKKASKLSNSYLGEQIESLKKIYHEWLVDTDFSIKDDTETSKSLEKQAFDNVDLEILRVQSQLDRLSERLYELVSKKGLEHIKFIRKRAEDLIAKALNQESDPLGLYHEIYKKKFGAIRFFKENLEKTPYRKTYYDKGTVLLLYNPVNNTEEPFIVFSSFSKCVRELRKEFGNCVTVNHNYRQFLLDFILMLSCLLRNVKIELITQVTENELKGYTRSYYEKIYNYVITFKF